MTHHTEASLTLPDFYREKGAAITPETIDRIFKALDHPYIDQGPSVGFTISHEEAPDELQGIRFFIAKPTNHRRHGQRCGLQGIGENTTAVMNHDRTPSLSAREMTEAVGSRVASYIETRRQVIEKSSGRLAVVAFVRNPS